MTDWVKPQRLDYLQLNDSLAVVRLSAELTSEMWPRYPGLLVGAPHGSHRTLALGSLTHDMLRRRTADELLWRVTFAVPLDLVQCPRSLFALVASGYSAARLPDPWLATLAALSEPWPAGESYNRFISAALARRAAALGTALAVAGGGSVGPLAAAAAAQGAAHGARTVVVAPRQLSAPAAAVSIRPVAAAGAGAVHSQSAHGTAAARTSAAARSSDRARPTLNPVPAGAGSPASHRSRAAGVESSQPASKDAARPATHSAADASARGHQGAGSSRRGFLHRAVHAVGSRLSSLSSTPPAGLAAEDATSYHRRHSDHRRAPAQHQHRHHPAGGAHGGHRHPSGGASLPTPKPAPAPLPPTPDEPEMPTSTSSPSSSLPSSGLPSSSPGSLWTAGLGLSRAEAALLNHISGKSTLKPPQFLIAIYQKAGAKYHIPWQVLAAINSIETDYGRDLNVSPAGAIGWMQFMPSTWAQYGVAVDHSGPPNPYNPADAIFSAARYLAANGGAKHIRQAIFAYNHAQWYVDEVLWRAAVINAVAHGKAAPGFANPFPNGWIPNRLDMGYDGTFGRVLTAPFSGTITYAARSFSNWGGYVELRADHAIKGLPTRTLYFAEGLSPLFRAGTHVIAGTPIAKASPSPWGNAYNTTGGGQGQIEWGLAGSGPTGAPTNPLAEAGIADPARMVKTFAIWAVEHLGVAPPASTDHAGYA
jgi:hypothetical protein